MSKDVVIIGAGGHAKVIADIVLCSGDNLVGFLDDNMEQGEVVFDEYEVIGKASDTSKYPDKSFVVAIGDNHVRADIVGKFDGLNWYTAIHPDAVIAKTCKVGEGTVVMAGVVVNPDAVIGRHCILNTSCSIDHDNVLGDFVHVSPGARLAGTVSIGAYSWICAGATVINNVSVTSDVVVGAGGVVIGDIEEPGVYVGVPVRGVG